jgi:hypothetical protein
VEVRTTELSATNEQLNHEAAERKILERSLDQRIAWLSAINKVHQTIAGEADLARTYEKLGARIIELLDASLVFISHWNEQGEQMDVYCYSALEGFDQNLESIRSSFQQDSPLRREIELGKIIILSADQAALLLGSFGQCFHEHDFQSLILSPMVIHLSVVGVLGVVVSKSEQEYGLLSLVIANLGKSPIIWSVEFMAQTGRLFLGN